VNALTISATRYGVRNDSVLDLRHQFSRPTGRCCGLLRPRLFNGWRPGGLVLVHHGESMRLRPQDAPAVEIGHT
jgi:hypothetical protein